MRLTAQTQEVDRIYSLVTSQGYRSVAITACNPGEGVSSVAMALSQRCLLSGQSALLVDLNLYRPSLVPLLATHTQTGCQELFPAPELMGVENHPLALTGVAAPCSRHALIKLRRPGILEQAIEHWQRDFDIVIIDTSPLNRVNANNVPAERAAAACDGTLLSVLSGRTSKAQVIEGVARLNAAGAAIAGCILNDKHTPPLRTELLREIKRLNKRFRWLAIWLRKKIRKNRLLSLEV